MKEKREKPAAEREEEYQMADDNSQLISSLMGMLGDNPQEKISAVLSSPDRKPKCGGTGHLFRREQSARRL